MKIKDIIPNPDNPRTITYKHKLTGTTMFLKKDYGEVASCFIQEITIPGLIRQKTDVVVCAKTNLLEL